MLRRLLLSAAFIGGAAACAAPVPKSPPPPAPKTNATFQLGVAKTNGELIQLTYSTEQTTATTVLVEKVIDGKNVTATQLEYQTRTVPVTMNLNAKSIKATTAGGKELDSEDLSKALANGAAVVRTYTAFDPEWKKLFADDVIFLDTTVKAIGVGGAGGVIRPAVIRPLPAPLPAAPVLPPVIEKFDVAPVPVEKKK